MAQRITEIVVARDLAQAANLAKSEFLANLSRELRTPMHAIVSYAALGKERVVRPNADLVKREHFFERIHGSADRPLRILNALLDLAKLEAGKMTYRMCRCDVGTLVQEAAGEFETLCRDKKVRIWVPPGDPCEAWAGPLRMGRVLRNGHPSP